MPPILKKIEKWVERERDSTLVWWPKECEMFREITPGGARQAQTLRSEPETIGTNKETIEQNKKE